MQYGCVLLALVVFSGCRTTPGGPEVPGVLPSTRQLRISENRENVLSAVVTITTRNCTAAAIEIFKDSVYQGITPFKSVVHDTAVILVLGLRPASSYELRAKLLSPSGNLVTSTSIKYSTRVLPVDFPRFTEMHTNSPTVRYVMLGIVPAIFGKSHAVIIDTGGNPVWYKEFREAVVDFQKQPNGRHTAWSSIDGTQGRFYEFDGSGTISATFSASQSRETGPHELRVSASAYALFGLDYRTMDLTAYGGLSDASVKGIVVEYHRSGQAPFLWNSFDHFTVTDAASDISLTGRNVNPWHGNAIEIDEEDNLLVSFRNMDEISKIDTKTGEIIWRLGGKQNQFTFRGDQLNGFSHQHGIRKLLNGNVIVFDNGNLHSPQASRVVEYRLDEKNKIAQLVWEYRPDPPIYAFALGFAQRLPNGNTLINFGTAQRVIEVDPSGTKRWEIAINQSGRYAYRAIAIESLY